MVGKILKSILTVALIVLISCLSIVTVVIYQDNMQTQKKQLQNELELASIATEQLGKDYLQSLNSEEYRLTWITKEGLVLFDSKADSFNMENHADREEIKEALLYGHGSSSRYSDTLTEKTLYEATQLTDGSILRISISITTVVSLMLDMLYPLTFIVLLAILISILLARRMAKQIVEPLLTLNLEKPLENKTYDEIEPLLYRLDTTQNKIKRQIQLLERKQEEFDSITKNMKEALVLLDTNFQILSMNAAAMKLFKLHTYEQNDIFKFENDKFNISSSLQNALKYGHDEYREFVDEYEYMFNINRIESEDEVYGIVILAFDITEQANAERIRREFTSNVSHELKTPLQSIIGSAELIEMGIVQPQDMPRFVGHIRKEASRLVTLIEDIMRLSQLDEESNMPMEEVSLRSIVMEAKETLLYAADEKQISIQVNGDEGTMYGVSSLLFEMIYNLIDNAIRYNYSNGYVNINIQEEKESIVLSVQDSGIGIPQEHHQKIFERFYRVDKSHSRKSGGTGLGLSIVKHAVKYHHGSIDVDSELGKGTHIKISLSR